nr:serine/threonine-protein kinase rad53 [Quercus suber]
MFRGADGSLNWSSFCNGATQFVHEFNNAPYKVDLVWEKRRDQAYVVPKEVNVLAVASYDYSRMNSSTDSRYLLSLEVVMWAAISTSLNSPLATISRAAKTLWNGAKPCALRNYTFRASVRMRCLVSQANLERMNKTRQDPRTIGGFNMPNLFDYGFQLRISASARNENMTESKLGAYQAERITNTNCDLCLKTRRIRRPFTTSDALIMYGGIGVRVLGLKLSDHEYRPARSGSPRVTTSFTRPIPRISKSRRSNTLSLVPQSHRPRARLEENLTAGRYRGISLRSIRVAQLADQKARCPGRKYLAWPGPGQLLCRRAVKDTHRTVLAMDLERLTAPTQPTQVTVDPRRLGRNNSGLSETDISDVMCILHPCSPAAFTIVADTAVHSPHNVLQNYRPEQRNDNINQSVLEEQETFILDSNGSSPADAMDLALRFSALPINPKLGFLFGRHRAHCDIRLAGENYKRISNFHFSIFMNSSGVLMLQDMSTNGTMVDEVVLKRKGQKNATRMLSSGSVIQILSPNQHEIVKFVVRIPSREGHYDEYEARFRDYMSRVHMAIAKMTQPEDPIRPPHDRTQSTSTPLIHNQYGMHWSGGEKYNVVGMIGKGAFATVYQLATKSEGTLYAAKELEKRKFVKNGILDRKLDNEMQIMKAISHPNIVRYVDYQDHANHLYIIMEFVQCGDLQHYLQHNGPLSEDLGRKMSLQILGSLAYLHGKKITHRDIKPDNILIADMNPKSFSVKLSDFGLSKVVKDQDTFLKTFCGTLLYCAPEVFPHYDAHVASRGQKRRKGSQLQSTKFHSYSQCVDVWSYGAVLWYSLCMKPPFEGVADATGRGMFDKIMMTPLDSTDLIEHGISDDCVQLLAEMLNTDPSSRPLPSSCLLHVWLSNDKSAYVEAKDDSKLLSIVEEDESEHVMAPDVSALRITDHSREAALDEVSIGSDSMNFFDPRQSKRVKSGVHHYAYREPSDLHEMQDSGERLSHASIPIMHQGEVPIHARGRQTQKLFGEISQTALDNLIEPNGNATHPALRDDQGEPPSSGSQTSGTSGEKAREVVAKGSMASPSLLGAESLLRDVHMHGTSSGPEIPTTPDRNEANNTPRRTNGVTAERDESTPRQPRGSTFNRRINIPLPASFFFQPDDPSTHTLEYASKLSGHDFVKYPGMPVPKDDSYGSFPGATNGSATEDDHDIHDEADDARPAKPLKSSGVLTQVPVQSEVDFVKPLPRLGRLVSTPDSFAPITLNLTKRTEVWGRLPANTLVHPDADDIRIPKRGIFLYFDADGIGKIPETGDITKLPGLYAGIATECHAGLIINGVHLRKGEPGQWTSGRIYSGDEIVVCKGPGGTMKFIVEIFHGVSKVKRPAGSPRFVVEVEGQKQKSSTNGNDRAKPARAK